MSLSATIITFNEEKNIARAINSLKFADEVIVVDTNSTDSTVKVSRGLSAVVYSHHFEGYGQQKNYAASLATNDWILSIDADEEVTEELKQSILNTIYNYKEGDPVVYSLNRQTSFCGKFIRHGGWYPDHLARLYKKNSAAWTTPNVHEELLPMRRDSKIGKLMGHLNHYSFPNVLSQIERNIKYAKLGAKELLERKKRRPNVVELLLRPIGKFIECYIVKRGFLDGLAGLTIAINAAYSMFIKYALAYWDNR